MSDFKILAGRYRLEKKVGEGGMAVVYRAVDLRTNHPVAVKILREQYNSDADYISRFQREAEAASKVMHHNIVNLLDVGRDGDTRYLVMEYIHGKTLKQVIQEKGQLAPAVAAQITIRILAALQHAHQSGIIHRDIKPQNILMNDDGLVKVADFGIARMANTDTLTRGNNVIGTVQYFSPEQASGGVADARSDIYSVGVVLYEMLTGRLPFDGQNEIAIMLQHLRNAPEPIENYAPDVPRAFSHVCMMALAKNPENRYQSAKEMAQELMMAMEGKVDKMLPMLADHLPDPTQIPVTPEKPSVRTDTGASKPVRRRPRKKLNLIWWLVTGIAALCVIVGIYFGSMAIYEVVVHSTTVPDFITMDQSAAQRSAERAGLHVEIVSMYHPTAANGIVILQAPEEGATLRKGDTVVLTVSKGPASLKVPSLTGMAVADATRTIQAYGLVPVIENVVSTDVQAGYVIMQSPDADTQCESGDTITLTVSGGAVIVPEVTGRSLDEAKQIMDDAGLSVSTNIQFVPSDDKQMHGIVAAQSPDIGTQVLQNTVISLSVYQVERLTHHITWGLKLNANDNMETVRVTLKNNLTAEYTAYQGEFAADSTVRTVEITLTAQEAGTYTISVYINGIFDHTEPNPVTIN